VFYRQCYILVAVHNLQRLKHHRSVARVYFWWFSIRHVSQPWATSVMVLRSQLSHPKDTSAGTVLVVDDDLGTRDVFKAALALEGFSVLAAPSVIIGIEAAQHNPVDLMLVDLRLSDGSGLDLIHQVKQNNPDVIFILISAFLTVPIGVAAMRLGALDVLEKPVAIDVMVALVKSAFERVARNNAVTPRAEDSKTHSKTLLSFVSTPRSVGERWASYVVRAISAPGDLKTLDDWARFLGVSYSTLCETSRLVLVRPHDARDFMRVLRALVRSATCRIELSLDVSDSRTMRNMLSRSGLTSNVVDPHGRLDRFWRCQTFIDHNNDVLALVRSALTD
jgi:FixJ family two-component response regulator